MKDSVIETSIDEFIQNLKKKGKMSLSEVADFFNTTQKKIEPWINILEERGFIEIKYPVIGEPKVILKASAPEKLDIQKLETESEEKPEIKEVEKIEEVVEEKIEEIPKEEPKEEEKIGEVKPEVVEELKPEVEVKVEKKPKTEIKEEAPVEIPKIREKMEIKPGIRGDDIEIVTEKVENLERKITELSQEVDISLLKEELSEILLITAGLRDIEKISFYLKEVLSLIHKMKEKNIWTDEDRVFVVTMLGGIARDWKAFGEKKISEIFDDVKEKVGVA
ncbi:MAG: hypothetical protein GTN36_04670 [Candidatus Aenigmarchaeota archaeon]|nr:hypothetical protein [Candidatus Aenigmarchaeota archaeon]